MMLLGEGSASRAQLTNSSSRTFRFREQEFSHFLVEVADSGPSHGHYLTARMDGTLDARPLLSGRGMLSQVFLVNASLTSSKVVELSLFNRETARFVAAWDDFTVRSSPVRAMWEFRAPAPHNDVFGESAIVHLSLHTPGGLRHAEVLDVGKTWLNRRVWMSRTEKSKFLLHRVVRCCFLMSLLWLRGEGGFHSRHARATIAT